MNTSIIRILDFVISLFGLLITSPLLGIVVIFGFFDTGSPIFIQERVGKKMRAFTLIKFRTMSIGTQLLATHMTSSSSVTKLGRFLRKTKIDELPQLINVLKGDMSLVGPRPCLFSQEELIREREKRGVHAVLPGITGLAQINGIDMSTPQKLAKRDQQMIQDFSLTSYFKYILLTAIGKGSGDRVNSD